MKASPPEKVINIVNFIRNVEPRLAIDLEEPVRQQMELAREYSLPTTWLLQYDSLCSAFFVPYLKAKMPYNHEAGIWFEIVQEQVEAAGLAWRGRYSWDWHSDKAFSIGYTPAEREKLADVIMDKFKQCFGYYPRVMGSWFFDARLLAYLQDKYGLDAACNCKDQYGTDGYTLWGGYWANAYYPNRKNAYLPARNLTSQIHVPVFRMLGSDPIYQYDADVNQNHGNGQPVVTLEPVYSGYGEKIAGGGSPQWCKWFFQENFSNENLNYAYAQVGQENSFGWPKMSVGLNWQYRYIAKLRDAGMLQVEQLSLSGRNFKERFSQTPSTSIIVRNDWRNEGHESLWYLSRLNRLNFYRDDNGMLVLRDFQTWSDDYAETFLDRVCRSNHCIYDALPIADGMLWKAGFRFLPEGKSEAGHLGLVANKNRECVEFEWLFEHSGTLKFRLEPGCIRIDASTVSGRCCDIEFTYDPDRAAISTRIDCEEDGTGWRFTHGNCQYALKVTGGIVHGTTRGCWLVAGVQTASFVLDLID